MGTGFSLEHGKFAAIALTFYDLIQWFQSLFNTQNLKIKNFFFNLFINKIYIKAATFKPE